jgi:succinate-semialdehyde dehydrogenase/glutarate-semialdehyde dehydrogenase
MLRPRLQACPVRQALTCQTQSWAARGKTFEVHDPSTGKLIGTCPEFDEADTKNAIKAAEKAFGTRRHKTGRERSKLLRKWYDLMVENADELGVLIP